MLNTKCATLPFTWQMCSMFKNSFGTTNWRFKEHDKIRGGFIRKAFLVKLDCISNGTNEKGCENEKLIYLTQFVANAIQTNHSLHGTFEKTERVCNEYFYAYEISKNYFNLQRKHDRGRIVENNINIDICKS